MRESESKGTGRRASSFGRIAREEAPARAQPAPVGTEIPAPVFGVVVQQLQSHSSGRLSGILIAYRTAPPVGFPGGCCGHG